jgi:uncharacterized protein (TIGR02147 family)
MDTFLSCFFGKVTLLLLYFLLPEHLEITMKTIFEYIDYRQFLKDYYAGSKQAHGYFSYRYFSKQADIKSPVFLKLVIDGKRNLTAKAVEKFNTALKFKDKEATYFRHLVFFNQAKTSAEKQEHYLVLKSMAGLVNEHVIGGRLYDFYDKWYISVVRELVTLRNFHDNFEKLAAAVIPRITPAQARDAIDFLLKSDLIARNEDGTYRQTNNAITTGQEVSSIAIRNFNRKMIQLAEQSLDAVPADKRHASGITMGISPECYNVLTAEINAFKDRIIAIVNADDHSSRVYQLNVQLFPLSRDQGGADA